MCHTRLYFGNVFNLDILADFEGGDITSDAGGLILKEIDQAYRLTDNMAKCLTDGRQNGKIKHTIRLKLLKIGARVRQTARKVWFHLASGYPYQDLLAQILQNIRTAPT